MFNIFIKFIKQNKVLYSGLMMSGLSVSVGVLGYLFQILMGRLLDVQDFGLFSSIMGVVGFLNAPINAVCMVIVREISALRIRRDGLSISNYYIKVNFFTLCLFAILIIICWLNYEKIFYLLKFNSYITFNLFIGIIFFIPFVLINSAFFQGNQQFQFHGAINFLGIVLKLMYCWVFTYFGLGLDGAFGGVLFGILSTWIIGFYLLKNSFYKFSNPVANVESDKAYRPMGLRDFSPLLIASIAIGAMTQLDIVIVGHYFSDPLVGEYAAASILGKAVLYLPSGLIIVLFPMTAELYSDNRRSHHLLLQSLGATFLMCLAVAFIYYFFSEELIRFFYGHRYSEAGHLLRWYGFAILPMALLLVIENYLMAKGEILFTWLLLFIAPIEILTMIYLHSDLLDVILILGLSGLVSLFLGLGILLYRNKISFKLL